MRGKGEVIGAVDFGSHEIRVVVARCRENTGTIQVLGHGVVPGRGCISQGVVQDINAARLALKHAQMQAERQARARITSLFAGINGKNVETFIREGNVELEHEVVEQPNVFEALDIASHDILAPGKRATSSITAQEWYVDGLRVSNPLGIKGHVLKARVHFARIPTVIQDNLLTCIQSPHYELEDVVFTPLAAALGCLTQEDLELGVAVLDMGRTTTGVAVYRDYRILSSYSFEWGGYHITRDVAAGLQISFDEADELVKEYGIPFDKISAAVLEEESDDIPYTKIRHGDHSQNETPIEYIQLKTAVPGAPDRIPRDDLEQIILDRAKELIIRIRQLFHSRGLLRNLVRGVVLTGGASLIQNQVPLAEAIFQCPCRLGYPVALPDLPEYMKTPQMSASMGILLHGFEYRIAAQNGQLKDRAPKKISTFQRLTTTIKKFFF